MLLGSTTTIQLHAVVHTIVLRAANPSEEASLGGKKAKTPIIAGTICGGIVLIGWLIGFAVYFRKRYNRKKRNQLVAEGKAQPREKDIEIATQKFIIPPDPAVLLGQRQPGEIAFPEDQETKDGHHRSPWSRHGSHTKPNAEGSPSQSSDKNSSPNPGHDTSMSKGEISMLEDQGPSKGSDS